MPTLPVETPIDDTIPKVDHEIAVGENLEFQRKWWKFENGVWLFFLLLLLCDVLGVFGRGWLAKAQISTADQTLALDYERVERAGTPSIMTLHFGSGAIHQGTVRVFVSESVIKRLGAQRVSPQPAKSTLAQGGIVYTFDAEGPSVVEIALSPSFPGRQRFRMNVVGAEPVEADVYVVP